MTLFLEFIHQVQTYKKLLTYLYTLDNIFENLLNLTSKENKRSLDENSFDLRAYQIVC